MQKNAFRGWSTRGKTRYITQTVLVMRLTVFLLTAAFLNVSAEGLSQNVTLSGKHLTLEKVFKEVKHQTGYYFLYPEKALANVRPVDVQVENMPLREFLDLVFKGQPLSYIIESKTINVSFSPDVRWAQLPVDDVIRVKITDAAGNPLAGASVMNRNTKRSGMTDADGVLKLNISEGDVLHVSFVGFEPKQIKFTSATTAVVSSGADGPENATIKIQDAAITIALTAAESRLNEVVVNKGYYKQSSRLNTGSVVKITSEEIRNQPVVSPLLALQGRVAGLQITPPNGAPGAAPKVTIRGYNSLRAYSSYPLYVIDGVIIESNPLQSTSSVYSGGVDPLENLNPENIESVEVLKDADATAIYGSRGANGVILITTKRPSGEGGLQTEIKGYNGIAKMPKFLDLLNTQQYLEMRKEAMANGGTSPSTSDYDFTRWDSTRYTDWQRVLLDGTGHTSDLQANLSFAGRNTSFRMGGGYHKEGSFLSKDHDHRRMAGNLSINHLSEKQKFSASINVNYGTSVNKIVASSSLFNRAISLAPNAPALYNEDGSLNWDIIDNGVTQRSAFTNPLGELRKTTESESRLLTANSVLQLTILPGVVVRTSIGFNEESNAEINKLPIASKAPVNLANSTASATFGNNSRKSWIIEPQINVTRSIQQHHFEAIVGTTFQDVSSKWEAVEVNGYPADILLNSPLGGPDSRYVAYESGKYRYTALYARLGYDWNQKYLINLTGRRDGSSRFGPGRQFGNFGAVGAAWVFSEEHALKNSRVLSFGKLRGSIGITGNDQIGDYQFLDLYSIQTSRYQNNIALEPLALPNDQYQWEVTRKLEMTLETGFLKDRINLQVSWYRNRSSNQLIMYTLPYTTGFESILNNFGATLENSGWEILLQTTNIRSKTFKWATSFNLSIPRDKLVAFPGIETSPYATTYKVGESIMNYRIPIWEGVDPQTGLHVIKDADGNGIINSDDFDFWGSTNAKYFGGLQNTLSWRSFSMAVSFQLSDGKAYGYYGSYPPGMFMTNEPVEVMDRWRKPGDQTNIAKATTDYNQITQYVWAANSGFNIFSTAFVKLKTLSLAYDLPKQLLSKYGFRDFRISAHGQNLWVLTKFKGLDPETGARSLPQTRQVMLALQLGF